MKSAEDESSVLLISHEEGPRRTRRRKNKTKGALGQAKAHGAGMRAKKVLNTLQIAQGMGETTLTGRVGGFVGVFFC